MSLIVNSITPANNVLNIPIDSQIVIELDQEVDPFTISTGIAIYTPTDQLWIGSAMSVLDTEHREVMDIGEEYSYLQYSSSISGNTITLTPLVSLLPDRKYYIAIFPGDDASRYLSAKTYSDPEYFRVGQSDGELTVTSAYSGDENIVFTFNFNGDNTFDLLRDGLEYIDTFSYVAGEEFDLGGLGLITISLSGTFDNRDALTLDVFAAVGTSTLYRNSFTTSEYETVTPEQQSVKITSLSEALGEKQVQLINSIPEDLSINNLRINPITLKFNQSLQEGENLADKITIRRKDLITGQVKRIGYHYSINGNTIKLFMVRSEV